MKKAKITPEEKFTKVNNIAEARTLELEFEDNMDQKLYVLTEITKALIDAGCYNSAKPDIVVDAAEKITEEILKRVEK